MPVHFDTTAAISTSVMFALSKVFFCEFSCNSPSSVLIYSLSSGMTPYFRSAAFCTSFLISWSSSRSSVFLSFSLRVLKRSISFLSPWYYAYSGSISFYNYSNSSLIWVSRASVPGFLKPSCSLFKDSYSISSLVFLRLSLSKASGCESNDTLTAAHASSSKSMAASGFLLPVARIYLSASFAAAINAWSVMRTWWWF